MGGIPNNVLDDLVKLGELPDGSTTERNQLFKQLMPFTQFAHTHWDEWNYATDKISVEQLYNLVCGLVVAEESLPEWNGGSVSSIIWTFRAYERRAPENSDKLAEWVLQHSTNDCVPYGSARAGAKSIAEYKAYRQAKHLRRVHSEKHSEAEQHCKAVRESVTKRLHQESLLIQSARAQARQELIAKLDKLTSKERLEHIAWDDEHDLTFYPENYAEVTRVEIDSLDMISRERLISKIEQRHKGPWAKLFSTIGVEKLKA
jgi:hypothetical protein